jgi:DNA-binding transcriptional LysR family regulator
MARASFRDGPKVLTAMASFDLRALEVFLAVCESGGMGRAAQALGVTQAAVSQQIARLEAKCSTSLFERAPTGLRITPAGARLRYHARRIATDVGEAEAAMRALERPELAHLTICIMETLGDLLAPALVARCKQHAAHIEVATGVGLNHSDGLVRNVYDIAVTSDLPADTEGLEIHELIVEPCVAVVPAGLLQTNVLDLQALAYRLPLVRYGAQRRLGRMIDRYLAQLRLDIPQTLDFDRASLVIEMVSRGQGWAITTPFSLLHARLPLEGIEIRRLPPPVYRRHIALAAKSGRIGTLPGDLAELCRAIIAAEIDARILPLSPELVDAIVVGC